MTSPCVEVIWTIKISNSHILTTNFSLLDYTVRIFSYATRIGLNLGIFMPFLLKNTLRLLNSRHFCLCT